MKKHIYALLLLVVIALTAAPLLLLPEAEFAGADGLAEDVIAEINPEYEPWLESIYEPGSSEVESLLFALQAAAGSGFICYYLGKASAAKQFRAAKTDAV